MRRTYKYGQRCLQCGYCVKACPQGINIPEVLRATYIYQQYPEENSHIGLQLYHSLKPSPEECIQCGSYMRICPDGIDIPKQLKEAVKLFKAAT